MTAVGHAAAAAAATSEDEEEDKEGEEGVTGPLESLRSNCAAKALGEALPVASLIFFVFTVIPVSCSLYFCFVGDQVRRYFSFRRAGLTVDTLVWLVLSR